MRTLDDDMRTAGATDRPLRMAAALFTAAVLIHNFDHVRRGVGDVPRDVFWVGTAAILLEVGVVWLIHGGHRLAPAVSVFGGVNLALGYVFVHFTPQRSWLSDSLLNGPDGNPLSWLAAGLETVTALLLAWAGWSTLRRRGGPSSRLEGTRPLREVAVHPVVLAATVGNAIVLAISFATL